MKKKKGLALLCGAMAIALCGGIFAACGEKNPSDEGRYTLNMSGVYAYAVENGYTGTFEELVAAVRGEKGADGVTPHIGEDGYWYFGDQKSEYKAVGADGSNGKNGKDGEDGKDGDTPYIKDGYWYIGNENTGYKATGDKGDTGNTGRGIKSITMEEMDGYDLYTITYTYGEPATTTFTVKHGQDGKDGSNGKDGANGTNGKDGKDGKDGVTPHIGEDGYWYFGDQKTDYKAVGEKGEDGKDGSNGADGKDGTDGKDGVTPHIGEDGYWYFGDQKTDYKAVGTDGKDGKDGKDGADGKDGRGISKVEVVEFDDEGYLVLYYDDDEELARIKLSEVLASAKGMATVTYRYIEPSGGGDTFGFTDEVVKGDRALDISVYGPAEEAFYGEFAEYLPQFETTGTWYYEDAKGNLHEWLFEVYPVLGDMELIYKLDGAAKTFTVAYEEYEEFGLREDLVEAKIEKEIKKNDKGEDEETGRYKFVSEGDVVIIASREVGDPTAWPASYKGTAVPVAPAYAAYIHYIEVSKDEKGYVVFDRDVLKVFAGWSDAAYESETPGDKIPYGNVTYTAQWMEVEYGYNNSGIAVSSGTASGAYAGSDKVVIVSGDDLTSMTGNWFYQTSTVKRVYIISDTLTSIGATNIFKQMKSVESVLIDAPELKTMSTTFELQNATVADMNLRVLGFFTNSLATLPASFARYNKNLEVVALSDNFTAWGNYVFDNTGDFDIVENFGWDYLNKLTSIGTSAVSNNNTQWGALYIGSRHFTSLATTQTNFFGATSTSTANKTVTELYIETYESSFGLLEWKYFTNLKHVEIYAPFLADASKLSFEGCTSLESIYAYMPKVANVAPANMGSDPANQYQSTNVFGAASALKDTKIESVYVTNKVDYSGREGGVFIVGAIQSTGSLMQSANTVKSVIYDVETLTTIANSAFSGASVLEHIEIRALPNQLHFIGTAAFSNAKQLRSIFLPEASQDYAVSVSYNANTGYTYNYSSLYSVFTNCLELRYISNLEKFATAFEQRNGGTMSMGSWSVPVDAPVFRTLRDPNGLYVMGDVLMGADDLKGEVIISANVRVIAYSALENKKGITSVKLAAGSALETIGNGAFSGCTSLQSVDLSNANNLTKINDSAFANLAALNSVTLPENAPNFKEIGYSAFNGCTGLKSIVIPASVTSLGKVGSSYSSGAVFQSSGLTSIEFKGEGTLEFVGNYLFSRTPVNGEQAQVMLDRLTKAMKPNGEELVLTDYMFYQCESLDSITIPAEFTKIAQRAFDSCPLASVTFAEGSKLTTIEAGAFTTLSGVTSFEVPKGVKELPSNSLAGFTDKLTSFTFEGGSQLWKFDVSLKNTGLTELKLPETVTYIGTDFLRDCVNFTTLNIVHWNGSEWEEKATNTLPAGVTNVGNYAFYNTKITSFTIPADTMFGTGSTKTLPQYMFADCAELVSVEILSTTVTQIGNNAFQNCTSLASIVIPASVTAINQNAFNGCSALKSVDIKGNALTKIDNYAFQNCSALESINFPVSLTSIGMNSFMNCTSLTKVVLTSTTTMSISSGAFSGCTNLTYFEAPANTNFSGADIFKGCGNLTTVKLHAGNNAYVSKSGTTAYTAATSVYTAWYQLYQNAKNGNEVNLIIGKGITSFVNYAFYMTGLDADASANFHMYFEGAEGSITTPGSYNTLYTETNVPKHYGVGTTWEYDTDGITPKVKENA